MTEAMPFLQKAILLSYDPRPFGRGFLSDACLQLLVGVDLHAGAHGGGGDAAADILALGGGGLGLDDGADEGVVVLDQLVRAEADLADGARRIYSLMSILTHVNTHPSIGRADSSLRSE